MFEKSKSKAVFSILLGVAIFFALFGTYFSDRQIQHRRVKDETEEALKGFSSICLQKFPATTNSEKVKNLRHCLAINTKFSADKSLTRLWDNKELMARWLFDYASHKRNDAPPMECSYLSGTLVKILQLQGLKARDVVITKNGKNFDDHVVMGFLNPDTKKWELHDTLYDVQFVSLENGENLGVKRMLRLGTSQFQPCNFENKCGWDLKSASGFSLQHNRQYWNVAWVKNDKTLYVSKRFDENEKQDVHGKMMSYCEYRAKWCKNVVHLN